MCYLGAITDADRIVEQGAHGELLEKWGMYYELISWGFRINTL